MNESDKNDDQCDDWLCIIFKGIFITIAVIVMISFIYTMLIIFPQIIFYHIKYTFFS